MFRTITVGLDGSPESVAAADWAALEAERREVPLRLLHVRPGESSAEIPHVDPEIRRHWAEQIPREASERLARRHPGLSVGYEQQVGVAPVVLARAVGEGGLLVLGSRGLGTVAGFLSGSVAQAVAAHAPFPVVLVRPDADESTGGAGAGPAPGAPEAADVVVGLDGGEPSEALLEFAFDAAASRGVPLRVVSAWELPPLYGPNPAGVVDPGLLTAYTQEHAAKLTDALRPWRGRYPDVVVREASVLGRPARELTLASLRASLVIVGRRTRRSRVGAQLGRVAHALIHHSPAPVAIVPHA